MTFRHPLLLTAFKGRFAVPGKVVPTLHPVLAHVSNYKG
jgi:hypothetical protein